MQGSMLTGQERHLDTTGLSRAGLWVRRVRPAPSLRDEALCMAQVLQMWGLMRSMNIDRYGSTYAEVSGCDLPPLWLYLVELEGSRLAESELMWSHPLGSVAPGEPVRLIALVQPPDYFIPGLLVETSQQQRMLWLRPECLATR